jgi:hypothetical protein
MSERPDVPEAEDDAHAAATAIATTQPAASFPRIAFELIASLMGFQKTRGSSRAL